MTAERRRVRRGQQRRKPLRMIVTDGTGHWSEHAEMMEHMAVAAHFAADLCTTRVFTRQPSRDDRRGNCWLMTGPTDRVTTPAECWVKVER